MKSRGLGDVYKRQDDGSRVTGGEGGVKVVGAGRCGVFVFQPSLLRFELVHHYRLWSVKSFGQNLFGGGCGSGCALLGEWDVAANVGEGDTAGDGAVVAVVEGTEDRIEGGGVEDIGVVVC